MHFPVKGFAIYICIALIFGKLPKITKVLKRNHCVEIRVQRNKEPPSAHVKRVSVSRMQDFLKSFFYPIVEMLCWLW